MNCKKKVLYVDDEPINLKVFQMSFQKQFDVVIADSGNAGLQKLKEDPEIAVVISDMKMPEMNGIEFIRLAKNEFPENFYFVLTAFDINAEITEALKQGLIYNHFQKPFNKRELEELISQVLS
jgi:response regulator RpfG family c-di-GMP phosphodiesterase